MLGEADAACKVVAVGGASVLDLGDMVGRWIVWPRGKQGKGFRGSVD